MMSFRRSDADLATLMVVYRRPEARVVVSMLQARGIAAFTPDWGVATVMPHLTMAFGGIAVLVPARDLAAPHELVASVDDVVPPRVVRGGLAWNGNSSSASAFFHRRSATASAARPDGRVTNRLLRNGRGAIAELRIAAKAVQAAARSR